MPQSVLQNWVNTLTLMQQSVLLASLRGPDGIEKDHVSKLLLRWMRRCILISAFDKTILQRPYDELADKGGSFTGPSLIGPKSMDDFDAWEKIWPQKMNDLLKEYMRSLDRLPHHFQLHFLHAAEILGYKHPEKKVREWWHDCYEKLVNDMHLTPETEERMDWRLGDQRSQWLAAEEITAKGPLH